MCTDERKTNFWDRLSQSDWRAFQRILTPDLCREAATLAGVKLGRGALHLGNLVWFAVGAAWLGTKSFAGVLGLVLKLLQDANDPRVAHEPPSAGNGRSGSPTKKGSKKRAKKGAKKKRSKHDPRGQGDPTQLSEEAFVQARRRMPWSFWVALLVLLTDRFEEQHGPRTRWKSFRLLALDGTTIALSNWRRLREAFGTVKNGRGRRTQARLVMLQLPLVRLPWRYELTGCAESEISVAQRLLSEVRRDDLVLIDRGFFSYGVFWQIQNRQAFFATRLKAKVNLRKRKKLGANDWLVSWQPADRRKKWKELPERIELRVIEYQMRGFRKSAVVTNVLDPHKVSASDWVRMAVEKEAGRTLEPGLYHRRWEIETTFRELKVTQGMEGKLRSRTAEGIRYEVAGHVLLYLLVRWLMVEAAAKAGIADPLRLSFKEALEELDDLRETLLHADEERVREVLLPRLLERIANHQVPPRPGRHYPRPRDNQPKAKGKGRFQKQSKLKGKKT